MYNVLYVSHTAQLGGAEHSLLALLDRIDRERFAPAVAVPGTGPLTARLDEMDVPHHAVPMCRFRRTLNPVALARGLVTWRRSIPRIARLLDERRVDLVHANSTTAHLFASAAARRRRVPCLWHVRDFGGSGAWLDAWLARRAAAIVAVSGAVREHLRLPERAEPKATVIHNGVDTDAFAPHDRSAMRKRLGLGEDTPAVGIVAPLVPRKGHPHFLRAAAGASARVPGARFLIIGDDRFGDFPHLRDDLESEAFILGIADHVTFTGWRNDAAAVINALDVLAVTSEEEPFGRVVIEAMACEVPVAAFRCGGPAEIIEHEATGLLVGLFDVTAMADAFVRLLSDRDAAAEMGRRGREVVSARFTAAAHAKRVQDLYDSILAEGGR